MGNREGCVLSTACVDTEIYVFYDSRVGIPLFIGNQNDELLCLVGVHKRRKGDIDKDERVL